MASYLRPLRGKRSTAEEQNIVLRRGEIFFEAPDGGVGTGTGRIKIGDGTTPYTSLPYFFDHDEFVSDLSNSTISFLETSITDNSVLLSTIVTDAKVNIITAAIKNLLANLNNSVISLTKEMRTPLGVNMWEANTDPTTKIDYPYIYTIPSYLYTNDSTPIWDLVGAGVVPTSVERESMDMILEAIFSASGVTLYATDKPVMPLTLRVKGV